jgi:hypothetical protein
MEELVGEVVWIDEKNTMSLTADCEVCGLGEREMNLQRVFFERPFDLDEEVVVRHREGNLSLDGEVVVDCNEAVDNPSLDEEVVVRHSEGNLSPDEGIVVRCDDGVDDQSLDDGTVVDSIEEVVDCKEAVDRIFHDDTVVGQNDYTLVLAILVIRALRGA